MDVNRRDEPASMFCLALFCFVEKEDEPKW